MKRVRILNTEPTGYSQEARSILSRLGKVTEEQLRRSDLVNRISEYDVLIVRLAHQVDREILDAANNMKAIVTATTGLDHIDVEYARSKGIAVLSLQEETDFLRTVTATPEHTWALLLALIRRIPAAFTSVRAGEWDRDAFRGHELSGKRLGLIGLGRVGEKVASYGLAFDMQVAAFDPYVKERVNGVAHYQSLQKLLSFSDVLSLHVPLNRETNGLIGTNELAMLPAGAVLINTSRGEIVEESALVHALGEGILAGAALDFLPAERDTAKRQSSALLEYARTHEDLLITPHLAGATYESMAKTEIFMAKKLRAFLQTIDDSEDV